MVGSEAADKVRALIQAHHFEGEGQAQRQPGEGKPEQDRRGLGAAIDHGHRRQHVNPQRQTREETGRDITPDIDDFPPECRQLCSDARDLLRGQVSGFIINFAMEHAVVEQWHEVDSVAPIVRQVAGKVQWCEAAHSADPRPSMEELQRCSTSLAD